MAIYSIPSRAGEKRRGRENFGKVKKPSQSRSLDLTGVNPTVEEGDSCQNSGFRFRIWNFLETLRGKLKAQ